MVRYTLIEMVWGIRSRLIVPGRMLRVLGAGLVISSGSTLQSTALARQSGAHYVFDYKRDDIAAEISKLTGGRGADLVFDATYSEAGFVGTAKTVRQGGNWIVLGVGPGKTTRIFETESPVDSILAERGARHVNLNKELFMPRQCEFQPSAKAFTRRYTRYYRYGIEQCEIPSN